MPARKRQFGARDIVLLPSAPDLRGDAPDLRVAVAETVDALRADQRVTAADAAIIALTKRYAERIEAAMDVLVEADDLWRACLQADDVGLARRVDRLVRDIELHEMIAKLGSELQKSLETLGATPAARAKVKVPQAPSGGRLQQLRGGLTS